MYPPLSGSGSILCIPGSPTGRPYPPTLLGKTGGTGIHPPLCGSGDFLCICGSPAAGCTRVPRSCLKRFADGDAPFENHVGTRSSHSHTVGDTPESLRFCLCCLRDRDPWCKNGVCTRPGYSRTAADTPKSLRSCVGRLGDRDTRGISTCTQGPRPPPPPTQRRIHPGCSAPACTVWGLGTPREGLDLVHTCFSRGVSPKPFGHDMRDSRASAIVWEWLDPLHPSFSHTGVTISQAVEA